MRTNSKSNVLTTKTRSWRVHTSTFVRIRWMRSPKRKKMLTINSSKWWVSRLTKATASSKWTTRPSFSKSKTTPCKCKWLSSSSRRWSRRRTKFSSSSKFLRLCPTTHSHLSQFPVVLQPRQLQLQMVKKLRLQMPTRQTLLVQWMETKNSDPIQAPTRHYHINLWESHQSTIKRPEIVTIIHMA